MQAPEICEIPEHRLDGRQAGLVHNQLIRRKVARADAGRRHIGVIAEFSLKKIGFIEAGLMSDIGLGVDFARQEH